MTYHPNASHLQSLLAQLVDKIDDWKRDICDWDEVEEVLAEARDEVESLTI